MKHFFFLVSLLSVMQSSLALDILPSGNENNALYYKIGGGANYALPLVSNTQTINLGANADLSSGYGCGAFNPALSLTNTLNNLKNSADNIEQSLLSNATGSLSQLPMYLLAQANPTLYNLLNNALLGAHNQMDVSVKSCQETKNQIAQGQDPYNDWATLAVNNQWKQQLSLTANGQQDINQANQDLAVTPGDNGVSWVQGASVAGQTGTYAGGNNQPPIHVIGDTVLAGYNAMLLRNSTDNSSAPTGNELAVEFPTPTDAVNWITNVVGDQTITTCSESYCTDKQAGISGRGLLPWITSCSSQNTSYCADNLRTQLAKLVTGQAPQTKANLEAVSAPGLIISPQIIISIQSMDPIQQGIIVNKLAQEVSTQLVIDRALMARNILQTGSQVPVIASNHSAQKIVTQAITHLDSDIQSLAFESNIRKQMTSHTLSEILNYQGGQQSNAMHVPKVVPNQPLLQNSAISSTGGSSS